MSMSVRCAGCGLQYAGHRGLRGLLPGLPTGRARYARMLTEVPGLPPARPAAAGRGGPGRRRHAGPVPGRRGLLRLLPHPLRAAAGGRGVVVPAGHRAAVPGPLPVRVPAQPRHAVGHRVASLADRHRRLPQLRARRSRGGSRPCRPRAPARAVHRFPDGAVGPGRQRPHHGVRRGRHRHPRRPGPGSAGPPHPGRGKGARRVPVHLQPGPAAHRQPAAAQPGPASGPRGTTSSAPATARSSGPGSATT